MTSADESTIPELLFDYFRDVSGDLVHVYGFLQHVAFTVIIPVASYLLALVGLFIVTEKVYRVLLPPSSEQMYREAIAILKRDAVYSASSTRRGLRDSWDRRTALNLLRRCIQRDPTLPDAFRTLATELLFDDASQHTGLELLLDQLWGSSRKLPLDECLDVIKLGMKHHPKDEELDKLRLEAEAIRRYGRDGTEGRGVEMMMRAGRFGSDHLGGGCRMR